MCGEKREVNLMIRVVGVRWKEERGKRKGKPPSFDRESRRVNPQGVDLLWAACGGPWCRGAVAGMRRV